MRQTDLPALVGIGGLGASFIREATAAALTNLPPLVIGGNTPSEQFLAVVPSARTLLIVVGLGGRSGEAAIRVASSVRQQGRAAAVLGTTPASSEGVRRYAQALAQARRLAELSHLFLFSDDSFVDVRRKGEAAPSHGTARIVDTAILVSRTLLATEKPRFVTVERAARSGLQFGAGLGVVARAHGTVRGLDFSVRYDASRDFACLAQARRLLVSISAGEAVSVAELATLAARATPFAPRAAVITNASVDPWRDPEAVELTLIGLECPLESLGARSRARDFMGRIASRMMLPKLLGKLSEPANKGMEPTS